MRIVGKMLDAPLHDTDRLLRGMLSHVVALADHAIPTPVDAADGLAHIGPRQFAVGKVVIAVLLVPNQPAGRWPQPLEIVAAKDDLVI